MSKVYVVMGGVKYEGESADTARVFMSREVAVAYGESLTSWSSSPRKPRYDYYEIIETEVE